MLSSPGPDDHHDPHMRRWLADLSSGKFDDRVHYVDVLEGDYFFLNGMLHAACCMLRVACCVPHVACCMLPAAWCVLHGCMLRGA